MKIIQSIQQILSQLFQTMLEIIEDQPSFLFGSKAYCTLMVINIFQISGYIFCTGYEKPYYDSKFVALARVNEVSPGTFLLLMKGNDQLTEIFFVLIQLIIYSYFSYVFILSYVKQNHVDWYKKRKVFFQKINQILIVFFTLYYWIFLTPFTEISLGMLSCNQFAFLAKFRDQNNCNQKPIIWIIMGVIGVILSVITNIMICFFFRSYSFAEKNLLKRKFAILQIPIAFGFLGLQFFYYINEISPSFKFISAQVMGLSMLLDILLNYPFRNKLIANFYILGTSFFWVSHTLLTYWLNIPDYSSNELFHSFLYFTTFTSFFLVASQNYQYNEIMRIDGNSISKMVFLLFLNQFNFNLPHYSISKMYHFFDQNLIIIKYGQFKYSFYKLNNTRLYEKLHFYLEEIYQLSDESMRQEDSKFKILEILVYHQEKCENIFCVCKEKDFKESKSQIDQQFTLQLIDNIFTLSLKNKIIVKDQSEREYLFLKYITFLGRIKNNPVRAYYELKQFYYLNKSMGYYFKVISNVISLSFEDRIVANQKSLYSLKDQSKQNAGNSISISDLQDSDQVKKIVIPLFIESVKEKIQFWESVKQGFSTIERFEKVAINFSRKQQQKIQKINLELGKLNTNKSNNNYVHLKVKITLHLLF